MSKSPESAQSETTLRSATAEDLPQIVSLAEEAPSAAHWPETAYARMFAPGATSRIALVAESNQSRSLAGFVIAQIISEDCELENIVVAPSSQHQGLAIRLIEALATAARKQNATRIFLEVRESNTPARALYEHCGFAISGRRPAYYNDPSDDAILYARPL